MKIIYILSILLAAVCFGACQLKSSDNREISAANNTTGINIEPAATASPVIAISPEKQIPKPSPLALPSIASSAPPAGATGSLTDQKVEIAVADMLSGYRIGGSVSVSGIQELPQQNSAIADLRFNGFEYAVSFEGGLLKAQNYKPQAKSGKAIPPPSEMFPPHKVSYSKDGKAILSRYTDGRWVLKEVRWGFDTGVKGSVEIR